MLRLRPLSLYFTCLSPAAPCNRGRVGQTGTQTKKEGKKVTHLVLSPLQEAPDLAGQHGSGTAVFRYVSSGDQQRISDPLISGGVNTLCTIASIFGFILTVLLYYAFCSLASLRCLTSQL